MFIMIDWSHISQVYYTHMCITVIGVLHSHTHIINHWCNTHFSCLHTFSYNIVLLGLVSICRQSRVVMEPVCRVFRRSTTLSSTRRVHNRGISAPARLIQVSKIHKSSYSKIVVRRMRVSQNYFALVYVPCVCFWREVLSSTCRAWYFHEYRYRLHAVRF